MRCSTCGITHVVQTIEASDEVEILAGIVFGKPDGEAPAGAAGEARPGAPGTMLPTMTRQQAEQYLQALSDAPPRPKKGRPVRARAGKDW